VFPRRGLFVDASSTSGPASSSAGLLTPFPGSDAVFVGIMHDFGSTGGGRLGPRRVLLLLRPAWHASVPRLNGISVAYSSDLSVFGPKSSIRFLPVSLIIWTHRGDR
jgi:hypothetical protein